jgi:hypothetical protein
LGPREVHPADAQQRPLTGSPHVSADAAAYPKRTNRICAQDITTTPRNPLRRSIVVVWIGFWLAGVVLLIAAIGLVLLAVLGLSSLV